jgi:hypothetical protein
MLAPADHPVVTEAQTGLSLLAALDRALEDIATVVAALSPEAYRHRPPPSASGSIGEHVRHCLDHVAALVSADRSCCLSYDRRGRGTVIETDNAQALGRIQLLRIKVAVGRWSTRLDHPILVTFAIARCGEVETGTSTLVRELAFVLNHTIHHQAMIGLLAAMQGFDVPEGFGYAPSTPRRTAGAHRVA